jgi:hypothetical protein
MRIDDNLRNELGEISAKDAADLLCTDFNRGDTIVTYLLTKTTTTARNIKKKVGSTTISADDVSPIVFWGGPPGNKRYYKGTLLTMLCDAILYDWATIGSYSELVVNHAKLQTT